MALPYATSADELAPLRNHDRPHMALGGSTPEQYLAKTA